MTINRQSIHTTLAHLRGLLDGQGIAKVERQRYRGAKIVIVTADDGRQLQAAVFPS